MTRIVIDLEWNQPLKGRTHVSGLSGEIIQIGAAKIDESCNVLDTMMRVTLTSDSFLHEWPSHNSLQLIL